MEGMNSPARGCLSRSLEVLLVVLLGVVYVVDSLWHCKE